MIKQKVASQDAVQHVVTRCPSVGQQVFPDEQRICSATDDNKQVTWWHCPVCRGWHVMKEHHVEKYNVIQQQS